MRAKNQVGSPAGFAPAPPRSQRGVLLLHHGLHLNDEWRPREDLHLEPPPSHGGMQRSYTSGTKPCLRRGSRPPEFPPVLRTILPCGGDKLENAKTSAPGILPLDKWRVAAAVRIARTSPRLQQGANLSQLRSANKKISPRGDAPRSPGYRPGALRLSYGEYSWLLDVDSHHDDPINNRTCYFDIIEE